MGGSPAEALGLLEGNRNRLPCRQLIFVSLTLVFGLFLFTRSDPLQGSFLTTPVLARAPVTQSNTHTKRLHFGGHAANRASVQRSTYGPRSGASTRPGSNQGTGPETALDSEIPSQLSEQSPSPPVFGEGHTYTTPYLEILLIFAFYGFLVTSVTSFRHTPAYPPYCTPCNTLGPRVPSPTVPGNKTAVSRVAMMAIIGQKEDSASVDDADLDGKVSSGKETSPDVSTNVVADGDQDGPDDTTTAAAAGLGLMGMSTLSGSTVGTTVGAACVGGACTAGAGTVAASAGTGGGILVGLKAWAVSGAIVAAGVANSLLGNPGLSDMVEASTSFPAAIGNGKPMVLEFYRPSCEQCLEVAKDLYPVEKSAINDKDMNWVMLNVDEPRYESIWTQFGVNELPHYEFLDGHGRELGRAFGPVSADFISEQVNQLKIVTSQQ